MTEMLDRTEKLDGFAQRPRDLRKPKNGSQTDLGQLAELHFTHIGRFERGTSRFEDRELLRQFQEVEQLPDDEKNVVKKLLDAFLTKKHLQALAR